MFSNNETRKKEFDSIGHICSNFLLFKKLDFTLQKKLVKEVEQSISNASIDKANANIYLLIGIMIDFIELYSNIGYNIKINIDINSRINISKPENTRFYLISNLYNFIILKYLKNKYKKYKSKQPNASFNIINPNITNPNIKSKVKFHLFDFPIKIIDHIFSFIPSVNAKRVGYMNPLELNPYINQTYIDALALRANQEITIKYSTMFTCSQCGTKKTQMKEIQTRSSDEGGTLFVTCLTCGLTWKMN